MIIPNILIVDDISFNVIALKALLSETNYNLFEANSGEECLKILLQEKIDVILMDVQMPNMDGFETAQFIKMSDKTKFIPIIFITAARENDGFNLKGYESGGIDIIYKPVNKDILLYKLDLFIQIINQQVQLEKQIVELKTLNEQNEVMRTKIEALALEDYLTGLANRRQIDKELETYFNNAYRNKHDISILMLDIDNFKYYNDHFGHTQGDVILQQVADSLNSSINRTLDCAGRFGGEEFVVILPETDEKGALHVAQNILNSLHKKNIIHAPDAPSDFVSVSIGVASEIPSKKDEFLTLLEHADIALYEAKNTGKDKIVPFKTTMKKS